MSWLDQYVNTATQFVDAPTEFQKVAAYWSVGAALGKRVYYQFGMVPVYPNLYSVFVGRSGFIKKSLTKNFALDVLGMAVPDLDLPGRGSPESFRDSLEERNWYGVLHYDEFYEYLTKKKKDYSSDMDVTVMELFAHGRKTPIRTKTSGEIKIPSNAIIAFIAPTTLDYMLKGLNKDDFMSGKMARFMLTAADQDIEYPVPPPMPQSVIPHLAAGLKKIIPNIAATGPVQPIEIKETPEAREMLEAVYYGIKDRVQGNENPYFGGSFSRAQMYAIKLAMIHAVAEGRAYLMPEDYEATMPMITSWADTLSTIVEKVAVEDRFHEVVMKAESFLKQNPTTTQRDFQRIMRLRKYEMTDVMEHLKISGIISIIENSDSGSSILRYRNGVGKAPTPEEVAAHDLEAAENPPENPGIRPGADVNRPVPPTLPPMIGPKKR